METPRERFLFEDDLDFKKARSEFFIHLEYASEHYLAQEVRNHEILKKSKYVVLKNNCNLTVGQPDRFEQIIHDDQFNAQSWTLSGQFKSTVLEEHELEKSLIVQVVKLTDTM